MPLRCWAKTFPGFWCGMAGRSIGVSGKRCTKRAWPICCGAAARFPQAVKDILQQSLALRLRRSQGAIGEAGLAVARGRLERDLPELLTFFDFPPPLWRKLRTTNAIERCFVEVRRRTRPMVVFVNLPSVERIV
jgi:Transposase, Mutator family